LAIPLLTASKILIPFLDQGLSKKLDCERLARVGSVIMGRQGNYSQLLFLQLANHLCNSQLPDGGWVDVEETAWCLSYLQKTSTAYQTSVEKGINWLNLQRIPCAGWGRNARDKSRIPYTSWVAALVPELIDIDVLHWLEMACEKELAGDPILSYKLALPLVAFHKHSYCPRNPKLTDLLVLSLTNSRNDDGGFAPWRGHPCGSDPWCTAVATLGLLTQEMVVPREVFKRVLDWFEKSQLPSGFWPYHYIDEGTALAYWAVKELLVYLKEQN